MNVHNSRHLEEHILQSTSAELPDYAVAENELLHGLRYLATQPTLLSTLLSSLCQQKCLANCPFRYLPTDRTASNPGYTRIPEVVRLGLAGGVCGAVG